MKMTTPKAPKVVIPTGHETPTISFEQPRPVILDHAVISPPLSKPKPVSYPSEASKWRHLVAPYLTGNGVEIATGGDPMVPHAIQIELSEASYAHYNSGQPLRGPVQWRDDNAITNLPFKDNTLDFLCNSHIIEDYFDWAPLLKEWVRVLKPGGRLVICVPDKKRWAAALAKGQPPNCAHKHESYVGELTEHCTPLGVKTIMEAFTEIPPGDYNIAYVGMKSRRNHAGAPTTP